MALRGAATVMPEAAEASAAAAIATPIRLLQRYRVDPTRTRVSGRCLLYIFQVLALGLESGRAAYA